MRVALISDVFHDASRRERLASRLGEARHEGADVAVLPEIPLNSWCPATRVARADDAEPPRGLRHQILAEAASESMMWIVGGAIVQDPDNGERYNTALVLNRTGALIDTYRKTHLPDEPGFWERDHYRPGSEPARPIQGLDMPVGIQICSDANRPQGIHMLSAAGAQVVFLPRATEASTWERWKLVLRATAMTACVFIVTTNRPGPELGVELGGPSAVVGPSGEMLLESTEPVNVVELDPSRVAEARKRYPGYLDVRPSLYAEGWSAL